MTSGASIPTERARIARPGRNCWRAPTASRAAVLVDAAAYFARLESTLLEARRSIFIVGWDYDGTVRLSPSSEPLDALLHALADANPRLEVRILVWNLSAVHGPSASLPLLVKSAWREHPRIELRLDSNHPLLAAHHQKIVCIDDAIAFAGGIDLTVQRWDTRRHAPETRARPQPDGESYGPVHDVQMVVDGEAARAVASLARDRWARATGEAVPSSDAAGDLWPQDLEPDFSDAPVLIARTRPAWRGEPAVCEASTLTLDAFSSARRSIYLEAQYLTGKRVRDRLAELLGQPHGPEVVIVASRSSEGPLERIFMGGNRDRFIRRLMQADRFDRLRVYHPVVPAGDREREILVHAKVVIVDDRFLRVGSSNPDNRSVGLDTECDLAVEASDDTAAQAIARIRNGLLAEHLGVARSDLDAAIASEGSLIRAIESLNTGARGLRPFAVREKGPTAPIPGSGFFDPEKPYRALARLHGRPFRRRFRVRKKNGVRPR